MADVSVVCSAVSTAGSGTAVVGAGISPADVSIASVAGGGDTVRDGVVEGSIADVDERRASGILAEAMQRVVGRIKHEAFVPQGKSQRIGLIDLHPCLDLRYA